MKKILIVDDEESIRWVLGKFFEKSGYEVLYAEDCKQALEKASNDLHLILLDIKLPEGSGLEVFRKIRADGITAPVIVLTAQSMMSNAIEAMKLGAYDYIAKPFDLDEINIFLLINQEFNRTRIAVAHMAFTQKAHADVKGCSAPHFQ